MMLLQCSICAGDGSFNFNMMNPQAVMIPVPKGITVDGVEGMETTFSFAEEKCQTVFCKPETCAAFVRNGAKEACGCEIN